jgi:ATP-dependent protease ClpP protease subunit
MANFEIYNEADNELKIDILGEIGQSFFENENTFKAVKAKLQNAKGKNITLNVSSLGGSAFEGLAIYDLLKSSGANITAKIYGATASAGTIVALGANEVQISENAFFLVHNSWAVTQGNKEDLREQADQLEIIDNRIIEIYKAKTGKSKPEIKKLMAEERWIDANEAKLIGFADKVIKTVKAVALADIEKINNSGLPKLNINQNLYTKMENVNVVQTDFKDEIESQAKELETYKAEISELKKQLATVQALQTENETLKKEYKALAEESFKKGVELSEAKGTIFALKSQLEAITATHTQIVNELAKAKASAGFSPAGDFVVKNEVKQTARDLQVKEALKNLKK